MFQVEPARRAYKELNVRSVITGHRGSQGAERAKLQPVSLAPKLTSLTK